LIEYKREMLKLSFSQFLMKINTLLWVQVIWI